MQGNLFGWLRAPGWAVLAGATALMAANAASAQSCAKDADCGDGYVCKSYSNQACDSAKPCPPDDKACLEAQQKPANCVTEMYTQCEPKPCASDKDCPDTMVCHSETSATCTGGGAVPVPADCKPGADCPQPQPQPTPVDNCTSTTVSACAPRWTLPCKQAADCGDGFDCKEQISYGCSGSGSAPAAGGGSAGSADGGAPPVDPTPPPQQSCTSMPTGNYECVLKDLPCNADADCPAGLTCQDQYAGVTCASPAPMTDPARHDAPTPMSGSASGSAGAGSSADAGVAVDDPCKAFETMAKKACVPPNYYARDVGLAQGTAAGDAAGGAPKSGGSQSDNGAQPPAAPGKTTGATHSASGSADESKMTVDKNTGCAVSATGSNDGALGMLSMLGLSVLALRRRARKAA